MLTTGQYRVYAGDVPQELIDVTVMESGHVNIDGPLWRGVGDIDDGKYDGSFADKNDDATGGHEATISNGMLVVAAHFDGVAEPIRLTWRREACES